MASMLGPSTALAASHPSPSARPWWPASRWDAVGGQPASRPRAHPPARSGDGKHHAGFAATTVIDRNDLGVDFNMPLGMDKLALGEKVNVELELQFVTD